MQTRPPGSSSQHPPSLDDLSLNSQHEGSRGGYSGDMLVDDPHEEPDVKPSASSAKKGKSTAGDDTVDRYKKRPRQVHSCTLCVRRKTKCDKQSPCSACVRRGNPLDCFVEGGDDAPAKQTFARQDDMDDLRDRLATLENLVRGNGPRPSTGDATFHFQPNPSAFPIAGPSNPALQIGGMMGEGSGRPGGTAEEVSVAAALQKLREGSANSTMMDSLPPTSSFNHPLLPPKPIKRARKLPGHARYAKELAELISLMPPREASDLLVASFFKRVDWHLHVLHVPMFEEEYISTWNCIATNRTDQISPAWLGTFFMVISLGLYYLPASLSPFDPVDTLDYPTEWRDISEKALALADWSGRPQARTIQAILMMAYFWYNVGEMDRLVVWVGAGVRVAQSLGLHMVDKQPINFTNDIFRIPAHDLPFFSKELGTRLWWYLCIFDWDVSYRCRNMSVLRAQDFSTPTPLNLSDRDIFSGPKVSKDLKSATATNYEILLSELVFLQQQWVVPRKTAAGLAVLPLETIISIDKLVRGKATRFADFFQIEKSSEPQVLEVDQHRPYIPLQRFNLNMEIQCRLLRLHRRCLFDSSRSEEALFSINASRQSSSHLLHIAHLFHQNCDFAAKIWWVGAYAILACVNILLSNMHLASQPHPLPPDAETRRTQVLSTLAELKSSSPISPHTAAGIRLVDALVLEEAAVCKMGPKAIFDANRYIGFLDSVAKAGIACSVGETAQMNQLADDVTVLLGITSHVNIPDAISNRLVDAAGKSLLNFDNATSGMDTLLPFDADSFKSAAVGTGASTPTSHFALPSADYDEFFRSLGFVAPPSGGFDGGDMFGAGFGATGNAGW